MQDDLYVQRQGGVHMFDKHEPNDLSMRTDLPWLKREVKYRSPPARARVRTIPVLAVASPCCQSLLL